MIVFAATRAARRRRRISSVASFVRVLGTVRVSDSPDAWLASSAESTPRPPHGVTDRTHGGRTPDSGPPRSH